MKRLLADIDRAGEAVLKQQCILQRGPGIGRTIVTLAAVRAYHCHEYMYIYTCNGRVAMHIRGSAANADEELLDFNDRWRM
eukprot:8178091-Pyramimonas_sp.AAC.1